MFISYYLVNRNRDNLPQKPYERPLPDPRRAVKSGGDARLALNELTLPEGYGTIERRQKVGNRKDGEFKAVDMQCSYNDRRPHSGTESGTAPLCQRMGSSRVTACSFSATITRQLLQEQSDQRLIKYNREEHNHDAFVAIKVHPRVRALTEEHEQSAIAGLRAGISAGCIVYSLPKSDIVSFFKQTSAAD